MIKNKKFEHNENSLLKGNDTGNMSTKLENEAIEEKESFEELFKQSLQEKHVQEGEIIRGTIVSLHQGEVMVDIGYKSEGLIPADQFERKNGSINYNVGDVIDVVMDRREDGTGRIILSKQKADQIRAWKNINEASEKGSIIEGKITAKVKGGLSVDIGGISAFLPASQVDLKQVRDFDKFINNTYKFTIIEFNKEKGNIVLSRKAILESEANINKEQLLKGITEGTVLDGTVKNITDYGAFVDLGYIDGLLHITDISWGRVNHPSDVFKPGDNVKVVVLKYDREKQRISLGRKQLLEDPWKKAYEKYSVGSKVKGKVVTNTDYGTFVAVEDGIEGLIHISEMSWTKKIKHPSKILTVGDTVEAVVLAIDTENKRLSLGLKQIEQNPWNLIQDKYPVGLIIERPIKNITEFGIFVELEEGIDGLIHVSDIAWGKKVKNLKESYQKGDIVKAKVMEVNQKDEKISLSIKELIEDPWKDAGKLYKKGNIVTGIVKSITEFGAFVELKKDVEGLIHISEIKDSNKDSKSPAAPDHLKVGEEIKALVTFISVPERKITLSTKDLEEKLEREEVQKYLASQKNVTSKLMDVVKLDETTAKEENK